MLTLCVKRNKVKKHFKITYFLNSEMGCVPSVTQRSTLSDEELDQLAKSTNNSRADIQRQYELYLINNPNGKVSKWNFRLSHENHTHTNGIHQMNTMRKTPIVSAIYGSQPEQINKSNWL